MIPDEHLRGEYTLRDATEDDFGEILALNRDWVHFTSELDEVSLRRLDALSSYHRVVERHGHVVAFLLALRESLDYASSNYRWFEERGGAFLYIDRVIVAQGQQGSGVATMLYADVLAFARRAGVERVVCEIDSDPPNEASRRFHDRHGFREVGTQRVAGGAKQVSLRELRLG